MVPFVVVVSEVKRPLTRCRFGDELRECLEAPKEAKVIVHRQLADLVVDEHALFLVDDGGIRRLESFEWTDGMIRGYKTRWLREAANMNLVGRRRRYKRSCQWDRVSFKLQIDICELLHHSVSLFRGGIDPIQHLPRRLEGLVQTTWTERYLEPSSRLGGRIRPCGRRRTRWHL